MDHEDTDFADYDKLIQSERNSRDASSQSLSNRNVPSQAKV
jgi:hypothetical protein